VVTAMNEMSATALEVARASEQSAQQADEINGLVVSSESSLSSAMSQVKTMSEEIKEANQAVEKVASRSKDITQILDVIRTISEQTNLLALNAAIEAARAGEHGRGFAVVADEVRALASKTQESTINIQDIIQKLQEQSEKASSNMIKNVDLIEGSVELADQVKASFEDISQAIHAISEINALVATASLEQTSVTEDISKNTAQANDLVQENVSAINETLQATAELAQLAQTQKDDLAFFEV